jgi:hypothetical protein
MQRRPVGHQPTTRRASSIFHAPDFPGLRRGRVVLAEPQRSPSSHPRGPVLGSRRLRGLGCARTVAWDACANCYLTLQGRERRITSNDISYPSNKRDHALAAYISGVDYYEILAFAGGRRTMVERRRKIACAVCKLVLAQSCSKRPHARAGYVHARTKKKDATPRFVVRTARRCTTCLHALRMERKPASRATNTVHKTVAGDGLNNV